ncbi:MAG: hypothetical protein JWN79_3441 [Gemmatimonadetes bacterium]|nr:hypothetical protein [Gemmatimonadota bacterium]
MHEIQPRLIGACSIVIGDIELTPGASHLFALLLAFSLAPRDPWPRRGLQELLFGKADDRLAAHRLRQLLYRLRGFGVVLQESSTGVIRLANPVTDPLDVLDAADLVAPHPASVGLDPLALYAPRMPAPFLDWLDQRRDVLRTALAARRMAELRAARERQDWSACARLASALYAIDPVDEEIVLAVAESNAMLGRRDTALDAIDQLLRDTGDTLDARPSLRRMRTRIASTRIARREGTLRGREECLAFLAEQWERATSGGGGRVCAIFGAPGMGKSRVGETFAAAVRLSGGQVVQHRCDGHARQSPLALFSQLVPDLRRRRGSIGADPALGGALDQLAPGPTPPVRAAGSAEERRDEVRRAIVDLLDAVSSEQPMLIVVDDAHLLDEASRSVVRDIADSTNTAQALVVLLCRPRPDGQSLLSSSARFGTYTLTPLSEQDSRALLAELSEARPLTDAQIDWAIAQADGNAFYLHALAQHPSDHVAMPAHIRSLAQSSYLGVSVDARTVLDSCLLLDTLASPARVARVAGVDDRTLLAAVRELEDADLLRYEDGIFAGPHAIIRDVLDDLMPSASRALLNHRIAELLSAECADPARARVVGWAAVRSWLACGDPVAAVELGLRVAREATALGEPGAGAILLSHIPRELLTSGAQRTVLDAIIEMADAGKCLALTADCLVERGALAVQLGEDRSSAASFANRLAHTRHFAGKAFDSSSSEAIALDERLAASVRADAIARILVDADTHFDQPRANHAYAILSTLEDSEREWQPSALRAELVYHTTFGCAQRALSSVWELLAAARELTLAQDSRRSYSYAVFALVRLGRYAECVDLAESAWTRMQQLNHLTAAEYFGGLAAEAHINLGNFAAAERMLRHIRESALRHGAPEPTPVSGVTSIDLLLGLATGDVARAERAVHDTRAAPEWLTTPRLREIWLSHALLVAQMRGDNGSLAEQAELATLFAQGSTFGAQDSAAECLWHLRRQSGDEAGASHLLRNYLKNRREIGPPEWLLRETTSADQVWAELELVEDSRADTNPAIRTKR